MIVCGGWDGVQRGYTFGRFLVRLLVILFGVKALDIIGLDYILITKTQFFQHYFPETKGCAGYHNFGFSRKEQIRQCVMQKPRSVCHFGTLVIRYSLTQNHEYR